MPYENLIISAAAAIRNHLAALPMEYRTIEEIHAYWNQWPTVPAPLEITREALKRLEAEGYVERVTEETQEIWQC